MITKPVFLCGYTSSGKTTVGKELAKRLLDKWLELDFKDESSTPKVKAIMEIEAENLR